ncbi:MAG TPA: polyphosphate polymerase domain-containing protein [bacterium]|nr:polyphosphate polymerase domain-containing protein [bacterium]HPN44503.1 polyphosphate polymerase domain-containing protein [bacterium]
MVNIKSIKGRSEIKYYVPLDKVPLIKEFIRPYADLDPYSADLANQQYIIRSIYLDSPQLDFYYQKLDGLPVRRKLRIRVYNEYDPNAIGFLEIKRRFSKTVVKERAKYTFAEIENFLNPENRDWGVLKQINGTLVLSKFLYNISKLELEPVVLIVYNRDAFIGKLDNRVRLTIDYNVRSRKCDKISTIFQDGILIPVVDTQCILELKYDSFMPKWMRELVHELKVSPQSISKYCMSIEKCLLA